MKLRSQRLIIGDYVFNFLNEVEINSTWKNLCDTGIVKLPRRYNSVMVGKKVQTLDKILKAGDKVEIWLGYDWDLKLRFKGYLKSFKPNYPIELEVEDEMYMWKRTKVTPKAFRGGDVASILSHIGVKNYVIFGSKMTVGDFLISNEMNTVARVLEKIKEVSGFPVFLRGDKLYIGGQNEVDPKKRSKYKFTVGKDIISHELEYKLKEDYPVQVEVISKQLDGSELKVTVGDANAVNKITKPTFGIKNTDDLRAIGLAEIDKVSYTGWRGKITVFGEPVVKHGDVLELDDMDEGVIKGSYYVDSSDIKLSTSAPFVQEIELGQIVS